MPRPKLPPAQAQTVDLTDLPGHCTRRLHQISVAIFLRETHGYGVTPIQYAILQAVHNTPGLDQRSLASAIALDTSTTAGVARRLQARALLRRSVSPTDRRLRLLSLTDAGRSLLSKVAPAVQRAQDVMLKPLARRDRVEFMRLVRALVDANNPLSRAPQALA